METHELALMVCVCFWLFTLPLLGLHGNTKYIIAVIPTCYEEERKMWIYAYEYNMTTLFGVHFLQFTVNNEVCGEVHGSLQREYSRQM